MWQGAPRAAGEAMAGRSGQKNTSAGQMSRGSRGAARAPGHLAEWVGSRWRGPPREVRAATAGCGSKISPQPVDSCGVGQGHEGHTDTGLSGVARGGSDAHEQRGDPRPEKMLRNLSAGHLWWAWRWAIEVPRRWDWACGPGMHTQQRPAEVARTIRGRPVVVGLVGGNSSILTLARREQAGAAGTATSNRGRHGLQRWYENTFGRLWCGWLGAAGTHRSLAYETARGYGDHLEQREKPRPAEVEKARTLKKGSRGGRCRRRTQWAVVHHGFQESGRSRTKNMAGVSGGSLVAHPLRPGLRCMRFLRRQQRARCPTHFVNRLSAQLHLRGCASPVLLLLPPGGRHSRERL